MPNVNRFQVNLLGQSARSPLVWHDACGVAGMLWTVSRICRRGSVGTDGGFFMKTGTALATTLFALASFPLSAQQPPPANQPNSPTTQQNPGTESAPPNSPAASPEAPAVEMSPVNGELVSKLDAKTAKTGDSVVVQTKASVKTADGTEIPNGAKPEGHGIGARPSGAADNSQGALQVDHVGVNGRQ